MVTAVTVLVVAGLVAVAGPATTPILLSIVLAAAAWAVPRLRPHLARHSGPDRAGGTRPGGEGQTEPEDIATDGAPGDPATTEPPPAAGGLESWSTRELCAAWQSSYFELLHAPDRRARSEMVWRRRRYLDELARRDPAGLDRWLAADSSAAGADPHRHFAPTESPAAVPPPCHPARDHPSYYRRKTPPSG